jgi:hypothetical protein
MASVKGLTGDNLFDLLGRVRRRASSRKLRLFACACCRRVWPLISDERSRRAVEVAERYADGRASRKELAAARAASPGRASGGASESAVKAAVNAAAAAADYAAERAAHFALEAAVRTGARGLAEEHAQAELLREVVGPPPRSRMIDPACLAWNDGLVPRLAGAIYEEGRFDDLPILADALMEAGCANTTVLEHCRRRHGHWRGCWLIDALLDKG